MADPLSGMAPSSTTFAKPSACRVVTSSLSARLLLAGQLDALADIEWSVVSGDPYSDAPPGLAVHHIPMRRELSPSDVGSLVALYRFFRRRRYSFVQTHTPKASLLGLPAARLAGIPTLYTVHGAMYFRDNTRPRNLAGWIFERWCCSWANRVLVQSREDEQRLPAVRICRGGKVSFVGNGIRLERFDEVASPAEQDRPVVLMIGRLVTEKGSRDFFQVAAALHDRARFVHVGPREVDQRDRIPDDELEEIAAGGQVELVGSVDDVRPYIAAADLVLLPSYREGIPRAAMESASMGRPVVGYDVRGVREVIPRELGLLVPRGDIAALVELVSTLLEEPSRRVSLGRRCRAHVTEHFSEDDVVERLRRVYAEVLAADRS